MIYGYVRVSTLKQQDGNSIEAQEKELKEKGADEIVTEIYTGSTTDRPKFTALTQALQPGDTLMVTKIDRFARTVQEGLATIDQLLAKGVTVNILNMGIVNDTPIGKLTRTILLAVAEFEREMIIQRTQEGKAIARQRPDFRDGRPPIETLVDMAEFKRLRDLVAQKALTATNAAKLLGVSRSSWYKLLKVS
ncbi:MAG: recombinase family protein [Prevotella sp.]